MNYKYKLGFIGCGNMAKAIINGLLSSKLLLEKEIFISTPSIKEKYRGIDFTNDNIEVMTSCEFLVLAVKPQIFRTIAESFSANASKCVISIMAGVSCNTIADVCKCKEVVRIMPNTPCSIGEGVSAITSLGASKNSVDFVENVFKTISKTIFIEENLFDAVTSVSGSGPAYVYYFIKAMIEGGVKGGLSYEQSKELALNTIIGASKMVENSSDDLQTLIQKVCSKGGTTIQAIDTFEKARVGESIVQGIENCRRRSEELSKL
ncbi:MAG: pyrroline-5-carboxylate reductase [Clostridia bacterium]|nr:pyrroline-5-carboxylate reductase [Clostridia bacterium]MDE7328691.1 pyrroline-5-carboxylate reductase [Clostridia bacterium]